MSGLTISPFSPALMLEIIRVWLEHKADVWFVWLLVATVALFVGILLDERAERILPMRYRITSDGSVLEDERRSNWQSGLRTLGFWLAVSSIIGEGIFEFLGARAEGRVREFANSNVAFVQRQASDANVRSATAIERGEQLGALLDRQRRTMEQFKRQGDDAQRRLTEATNRLDLELKRRGPRQKLLETAMIGKDHRLSPFNGQRVLVVTCLEQTFDRNPIRAFAESNNALGGVGLNPIDLERNEAADELRRQLLNEAHWDLLVATARCAIIGLHLYINPEVDNQTRQAAEALSHVLHDALLLPDGSPAVVSVVLAPIDVEYDARRFVVVFVANNPLL